MRAILLALPLSLLLGCNGPPPEAYVHGAVSASKPVAQLSIGKNAVGEDCTQTAGEGQGGADIYCGTWQQPSARVRSGGPAGSAQLTQLATASPWRAGIDTRFHCDAPVATTILGGNPAALMQCTRLVGGWSHVAMVAAVGGGIWYADGVLPAVRAMERSIGVLSGTLRADAAPASSAADSLLASRLAAQAFSSGDVGQFDQLMAAATRANLTDNPGAAESAFRAALALQQKALGKDNPNTATALMSLALQLSNEGRFTEADGLFTEASRLAPHSAEPTAQARLLHYQGLHALNQSKLPDALRLLTQADALYAAELPADALRPRTAASTASAGRFTRNQARAGELPNEELLTDPRAQSALLGLIEARRNRGVVLRLLSRPAEADEVLKTATALARANGLARPIVNARLYRTSAEALAASGQAKEALSELEQSTAAFDRSLPGSKPLADTYLLNARELLRAGRPDEALPICRQAVRSLSALKAGTTPRLMAACLDIYARAAEQQKDHAQELLAEMFLASQLAQGGITSQQIAQASATLAENARDPKVGEAIRRQRDLKNRLDDLYGRRDELAQAQQQGVTGTSISTEATALDRQIDETQAQLADADASLQAASPNYGQLVQQVAPADAVFAALHPAEAFVAITVSDDGGWTFLLHGQRIVVARVPIGLREIAGLVQRIRAGIELTTAGLPRFDSADAQQLYKLTLGGVAAGLDGVTRLVVAPTGPLLSLPFEVLLTGPADPNNLATAPWLARQFILSHVPAPNNFVSLRKIAGGSRAAHPWFGFGDFRPVTTAQARRSFPGSSCADSAQLLTSLPPLPFAAKELGAARDLLGASAADELLGANFTVPTVLKTPLNDYRILHFATHALLPTELRCQSEPAIVTSSPPGAPDASGALLTASAVVSLGLDADLVILSACNSGGPGGATAGESLSGLARAFFYAGARSLLVTHWSVNDQVAAFLVADTLRRMRENPALGVAAALRDAQLAMLADAGKGLPAEIAHPFFWAPFTVIGEGGEQIAHAAMVSKQRMAGL